MGRPLWLLDTKKEPLGEVGRYKDHWSGLTRMTAYQPSVPPVWTLLAVPLFCRRRLGIYFIEIPEYIERNNVATSELKRLADALAILLELWYVNRTQAEYTSEAIADLNQMLAAAKFPRLSRFGICYLSEPTSDGAHQWDDNKNVVFEAGMLHERTRSHAEQNQGEPTGWIPIREEDSPVGYANSDVGCELPVRAGRGSVGWRFSHPTARSP
jgi:hypothetical protein